MLCILLYITGLERIHRGYGTLTSNSIRVGDRQGLVGLSPGVMFTGFALSVALFGVANQVGIIDQISDILSKYLTL